MNKKEQARVDQLERDLEKERDNTRVAKALSWTQPVAPDVAPPEGFGNKNAVGFLFNAYSNRVAEAASSTVSHNFGSHELRRDGSNTRGARHLYSTKLRALQAMRHEVEKEVAARLAAIDKQIEHELALDASPNGTE